MQMVMGTSTLSSDKNIEDITAKNFKQSCQSHVSIIDETNIVLLELLADSHSNGIEIKFLSEGLSTE